MFNGLVLLGGYHMNRGTIKWFNYDKGYGFITPDVRTSEKDVFVHITALQRANIDKLEEGQRVVYETYMDRGRTAADILEVLK